jgi:hypothetical protein
MIPIKIMSMPSGTITDVAVIFGSLGGAGDRPGDSRAALSAPTVAKASQHMVELGMVRETTGKQRHRLYTYHRYLEILKRGTELPRTAH